jgi:CIC family chloride channel protein
MGVLFAAFLRAPLTSVFMVLEVSGNYSIILPVILANTIAYLISRILQPVPIFELLTQQDGLYLPSMEEEREEHEPHLEDAFQPAQVPIVQGGESVWNVMKNFEQQQEAAAAATAILVQCRDGGWYAARRDELQKIFAELGTDSSTPEAQMPLETRLGAERTPLIFPDQPLSNALPYFQRWPVLPVSNRALRGSLEGILSLESVLNSYRVQVPDSSIHSASTVGAHSVAT